MGIWYDFKDLVLTIGTHCFTGYYKEKKKSWAPFPKPLLHDNHWQSQIKYLKWLKQSSLKIGEVDVNTSILQIKKQAKQSAPGQKY